jgi:hypothetical protein
MQRLTRYFTLRRAVARLAAANGPMQFGEVEAADMPALLTAPRPRREQPERYLQWFLSLISGAHVNRCVNRIRRRSFPMPF